ncbi:zinc metalloproteinase-disintegrin-like HF3 [Trichonephila clavipes]|nr:zinc metalloproteinase-disintegrin-like HF3 [Trichonephila clavipes]
MPETDESHLVRYQDLMAVVAGAPKSCNMVLRCRRRVIQQHNARSEKPGMLFSESPFSISTGGLSTTGLHFNGNNQGIANLDTICTVNAVGLTKVDDVFQPHTTSIILTHLIGHNLGMEHDQSNCDCSKGPSCIMTNNIPYFTSTTFSGCSIQKYFKTLNQGYGACLFNMPTLRMSICGNSILEEPEECDCGPPEECAKHDPCCDPVTCRLIKHAECSSGPCCKKCKV